MFLDEMIDLSLSTGGLVKFDLKAFDDHIHTALCGLSNEKIQANFERAGSRWSERSEHPLIMASTPLVPGYIDPYEIDQIARFITGVHRDIPYSLIAFRPDFAMSDLPVTSKQHAWQAEQAARAAGLTRVQIENRNLLGPSYPE